MELKGSITLIMGSAFGIGTAMVRLFTKAGTRLALTYRSNQIEARALVEEFSSTGCPAASLRGNPG